MKDKRIERAKTGEGTDILLTGSTRNDLGEDTVYLLGHRG